MRTDPQSAVANTSGSLKVGFDGFSPNLEKSVYVQIRNRRSWVIPLVCPQDVVLIRGDNEQVGGQGNGSGGIRHPAELSRPYDVHALRGVGAQSEQHEQQPSHRPTLAYRRRKGNGAT